MAKVELEGEFLEVRAEELLGSTLDGGQRTLG
jgi:hypothetical protein